MSRSEADIRLSVILITIITEVKHMLVKAFNAWRFAAFLSVVIKSTFGGSRSGVG